MDRMPKLRIVGSLNGGQFPDGPAEALDDARLVAAVRSGNVGMAGAFYDRTRPVVEKTVRRLLGASDSDFDDMVQVAMIELLHSLDRFRGDCSLDTWTSTISANVVYKHIRRRGLERTIFSREIAVEDVPRSSHQRPVLRGMVERVFQHLEQMVRERAWTFLLHDVHGYSLDEVAGITGTTVAAAQSRLVRGRRELHDRIANDPDLAGGLDTLEDPS
jgi:RNA polymerase sigma-70 factor (ECF subfamily)